MCLVSIAYWRRGTWCANIFAHRCPPPHYYWRTDTPCTKSISPVVRIGTPNPLTRRWVCPPPPLVPGGTHLLAGEGVGGVPIQGDRHCGTLGIYHVTSFTSPIGGPNKKIEKGGGPKISVRLNYFHPNRLLTGLFKQETEILWRKAMVTLISKKTSIATVQYHLWTVASLPTPLIFHYPLPLIGSVSST